jgi:small subunit ribosomal protein S3
MGQKVNPIGLRLGKVTTWSSKWFAEKGEYRKNLREDLKIKEFIKKRLQQAGIAKVEIERYAQKVKVSIFSSRPGIVIGRKGAEIENLTTEVSRLVGKPVNIDIIEIKTPELSARLLAESIALQIEKRIPYRRVMKKAVQTAIQMGAEGAKVQCAGRLAGAEIARSEWYKEGRIPLHTLRANIDYAAVTSHTTYGCVGVKVWIFLGEVSSPKTEQKVEKNGNSQKSKT